MRFHQVYTTLSLGSPRGKVCRPSALICAWLALGRHHRFAILQATRWLSWYGVGLASADRLPVVVRIPAGPLGSLKCDPPKGNGR